MRSQYRDLIETEALRIGWDADLLEAQVLVESSDDPHAFRYEPGFYTRYLKGKPEWESWGPLAACSYGLLQVLYTVAFEVGFRGRPEELFQPATGLRWGVTKIATLRRGISDPLAVLASYNGGTAGNTVAPFRNQAYVQKVLTQRDAVVALRKASQPRGGV